MSDGVRIRDLLLISHDSSWCVAVAEGLRAARVDVRCEESLRGTELAVEDSPFDAVLLDLRTLPAPSWLYALEILAHANPAPAIVAWGEGLTGFEGFQLGRLGARKVLARRPRPEQVHAVVAEAMTTPPTLEPHLRAFVGHGTLPRIIESVRTLFLDQALGMSRGKQSQTACLLGVSRQAVQQSLRRRKQRRAAPRRDRVHARRSAADSAG